MNPLIEINPVPVLIGYVWYYEKINCHTRERYISVSEHKKRYGEKHLDNHTSSKEIFVYDEKLKEVVKFKSFKEASTYTSVSRTVIWEVIHLPFRKLVKKRYKFSMHDFEERKENWEYSNKKFT